MQGPLSHIERFGGVRVQAMPSETREELWRAQGPGVAFHQGVRAKARIRGLSGPAGAPAKEPRQGSMEDTHISGQLGAGD